MIDIELDTISIDKLIILLKDENIYPSELYARHLENGDNDEMKQLLNDLYKELLDKISGFSFLEAQSVWNGFNNSIQYSYNLPESDIFHKVAWGMLMSHLLKKYFSLADVINPSENKPRLLSIYPELREKIDKKGLTILDDSFGYNKGYHTYKEHILYYCSFLEGSRGTNLISKFNELYKNKNNANKFRIAFDFNRVCKIKDFRHICLFDTWYGPEFDINKIDDPNFVGLTVKKSDKKSLDLMKNLDRTEFYWKYDRKEKVKTFEIEEIVDLNYIKGGYNVNCYIHSERDTLNKKFIHLDGAIKIYDKSNYQERFCSKIPEERKADKYIKLFRIDGDISYKDWSELISFYYKYNRMIIEYFNVEEHNKLFPLYAITV
ncbi:MAG: hypothetical protein ABFD23_03645 [Caldisericales bacterium]|nr:hypothetical protein [bacterium]